MEINEKNKTELWGEYITPVYYGYNTFDDNTSDIFMPEVLNDILSFNFGDFYDNYIPRFKEKGGRKLQKFDKNLPMAIGDTVFKGTELLGTVNGVFENLIEIKTSDGSTKLIPRDGIDYIISRTVKFEEGGLIQNETFTPVRYVHKSSELIDIPIDPLGPYNFGEEGMIELPSVSDILKWDESPESNDTEQEIITSPSETEVYDPTELPVEQHSEQLVDEAQEIKDPGYKFAKHKEGEPKGEFPNTQKGREDFLKTLYYNYSKVLKLKGLDPRLAYVLTASASIEAAWGVKPSGHYNYGGVKVTNAQIKKGVPYLRRLTTDWTPEKGYHKHYQNFRSYDSIEDYCTKRIELLMNSRYKILNLDPSKPIQLWGTILDRGYAQLPAEGRAKYLRWVGLRLEILKKVLNS